MGGVVKKVLQVAAVAVNFIPGIGQIASLAISAALSVGASLIKSGSKAPDNSPENIDRLRANVDPRAPRKTVVGITAMATDIRDEEFTDDQTYFHRFIVVASHKVNAINEIWFDDKVAWTSAGGTQGEYVGYLDVTPVLEGTAANAINISSRMGSTRRYTGLAYVHLRYKLTGNSKTAESPFASSITTRITIRGEGAALPDPREASHDMDDQSTWAWDADAARNPALQLLFYLLGYKINGILAVNKGIPANRIDIDSFAVAANICDEAVAKVGGGTEPRYRADGVWSEGDNPTTVIDSLKASMNADLDDVGGKLRLTVFHNDLATPVADFTEDDVIGAFEWQQNAPLDQTYNIVRGAYTDASDESLYQQPDYPLQSIASDDDIDRIDTFNLPMVQSVSQAQRLAHIRLMRYKYSGVFRADFQATAWKVQKNSVIRLTFAPLGFVNKLFRVSAMEIKQDGIVPLELREENAAIYTNPALVDAIDAAPTTPYNQDLDPLIQSILNPSYEDISGKPTELADINADEATRLPVLPGADKTGDNAAGGVIGGGPFIYADGLIEGDPVAGAKLDGIQAGATAGDNLLTNGDLASLDGIFRLTSGTAIGQLVKPTDDAPYHRVSAGSGYSRLYFSKQSASEGFSPLFATAYAGERIFYSHKYRAPAGTRRRIHWFFYNGAGVLIAAPQTTLLGVLADFTVERAHYDPPAGSAFVMVMLEQFAHATQPNDVQSLRLAKTVLGADLSAEDPKNKSIDFGATAGTNLIRDPLFKEGDKFYEIAVPAAMQLIDGANGRYFEKVGAGYGRVQSIDDADTGNVKLTKARAGAQYFISVDVDLPAGGLIRLHARAWNGNTAATQVIVASHSAVTAGPKTIGGIFTMPQNMSQLEVNVETFATGQRWSNLTWVEAKEHNNAINIANGVLEGIGTEGVPVANTWMAPQGLASARPATGAFIGQLYLAQDTGVISRWTGAAWQTGADITSNAQITFSQPAPFDIQADSESTTTTDLTTISRSITVFKGGTAQTSGVTVGTIAASPSASITASASVSGGIVSVTLSKADSAGVVIVPVILGGVIYNQTIVVNRTVANAPSGGASGPAPFTDQTWLSPSTTSFIQVTDTGAVVQSDASGRLRFTGNSLYTGTTTARIKPQYSLNGTTWTDAAAEVTGSIPNNTPGEEEPGYVALTGTTVTGLTANTDYSVRLVARRSGGSGNISWSLPTFTVKQP